MPKIYKNGKEYGGYYSGPASEVKFYPDRTGLTSDNVQGAIEEMSKPSYGLASMTELSDSSCTGTVNWQRVNGMTILSFIDLRLSKELISGDEVTIIPSGKIVPPIVTTRGILSSIANVVGLIDEGDVAVLTNTYPGTIPVMITITSTGEVILTNRSGYTVPVDTTIEGQLMYVIKVL